jgi:hypothetical protein
LLYAVGGGDKTVPGKSILPVIKAQKSLKVHKGD